MMSMVIQRLLVSCLVSMIRFAKEHTEKNGEILVEFNTSRMEA